MWRNDRKMVKVGNGKNQEIRVTEKIVQGSLKNKLGKSKNKNQGR